MPSFIVPVRRRGSGAPERLESRQGAGARPGRDAHTLSSGPAGVYAMAPHLPAPPPGRTDVGVQVGGDETRRSGLVMPAGCGSGGRRRIGRAAGSDRPRSASLAAMARPGRARMDETTLDRLAIRELVENWAVWRDAGDWERFRTVWHDDGVMMATWVQGHGRRVHRRLQGRLGRGRLDPALPRRPLRRPRGDRAIAQTKMTISQRTTVARRRVRRRLHRPLLRLPRKAGRALGRRAAPAHLREGPHRPARPRHARSPLEPELLARFPVGYRHLAYVQSKIGYPVKSDMPGLKGPEVEALYARGRAWLAGDPL